LFQLHFCYSSQNTFQAAGNNGLFSYRKYFNFLQHSVRLWPEADQKSLLTWWNEYVCNSSQAAFLTPFDRKVFSHRSEAQPAKRADGSLSIAERMAAQAATAKAAISRLENVQLPAVKDVEYSVLLNIIIPSHFFARSI
jgi:hypothetical protein